MTTDFACDPANDMTRRRFLTTAGVAAGGTAALALIGRAPVGQALITGPERRDRPEDFNAAVPTAWFDLSRALIRTTPGFTPPVASRALAYVGVALYEAVVPGSRRYRSLQRVLPGLRVGHRTGEHLHWPTVANSALASMVRLLFPTTSDGNKAAIDALESSFADRSGRRAKRSTLDRSVAHGRSVAQTILTGHASMAATRVTCATSRPTTSPRPGPGCGCRPPRHSSRPCNRSGDRIAVSPSPRGRPARPRLPPHTPKTPRPPSLPRHVRSTTR